MSEATVAVLGFHKVGRHPAGGWESWFYVSEAQFGGFLADITETGWQPIDLQRFLRGLDDPASLPRRSALLTFDDGYRSMRHVMLPTLQKFGMPAVLFVPTDFVGARNTFEAQQMANDNHMARTGDRQKLRQSFDHTQYCRHQQRVHIAHL